MESKDIKNFVNQIFKKKGFPPVKNFAAEFADGSKKELRDIRLTRL